MNEPRDDLDRALADGLGALAPSQPDADVALASLQPRLRRARSRHRVMQASIAALAVVAVVAVGAVAANNRAGKESVAIVTPPTNETTPRDTLPNTNTSTTTLPTTDTTGTNGEGRTPDTPPPTRQGGPAPSTQSGVTPGTAPPATRPAPQERTFTAAGGTVTVRLADGQLSIVSYRAFDGFEAQVDKERHDEIEVRFVREHSGDSRVRVRLVNGAIQEDID